MQGTLSKVFPYVNQTEQMFKELITEKRNFREKNSLTLCY